jgi:hypothetical protein
MGPCSWVAGARGVCLYIVIVEPNERGSTMLYLVVDHKR